MSQPKATRPRRLHRPDDEAAELLERCPADALVVVATRARALWLRTAAERLRRGDVVIVAADGEPLVSRLLEHSEREVLGDRGLPAPVVAALARRERARADARSAAERPAAD